MTTYSNSKLGSFEQCKLGCQYTDVSSDWFRVVFLRKLGVNEGVNKLLDCIKKNPGNSVPYLTKALNTPSKTIERWLKQLRDEKKVEFKGSPKTGGYWEVR